ncbi:MAG: alpha/beta hydrolase [Deltaproteobacteria bacterium]|nr:alpha/beta hydrolase [Deltaproteobacteria bacterium]
MKSRHSVPPQGFFQSHTLRVRGARWQVLDTAPGPERPPLPVLLLLPGTLGSAEIFHRLMQALADRIRCVGLTYPALPEVPRLARGALGILDGLGIQTAHVLGSSLGGVVAQHLAWDAPERVRTLFLGNTLVDPPVHWAPRQHSLQQVLATPAGELRRQRVEGVARHPAGDEGVRQALDFMRRQGELVLSARHLKARILALLKAQDIPPPALPPERIVILECADDPVMPPAVRAAVRARFPQSRVHTLPSGGHFPYLSRPGEYIAILEAHLLP